MDVQEAAEEDCDEFSSQNDASRPARKRLREDTAVCSARLSPAKNGSSCLDEVTVKTEFIDTYVGICSEENPDLDTAKQELIFKEEELIPDFTLEVENEKVRPADVCRDQVIDPLSVVSVEIPHSSKTKQKVPWQYTHHLSKQSSRHIQPNMQGIFQSKGASAEEYLNTQEPVIDKVQENSMAQSLTCDEILSMLEEEDTPAAVYIGPNNDVLTDEDSAEEDEGGLIDNLSGKQLSVPAAAVFLDGCRTTDGDGDSDEYSSISNTTFTRYKTPKWSRGTSLKSVDCIFPEANSVKYRDLSPVQLFELFG